MYQKLLSISFAGHFVDDMVIYVHDNDRLKICSYAYSGLQVVIKWLTDNLLALNFNKTKFIT